MIGPPADLRRTPYKMVWPHTKLDPMHQIYIGHSASKQLPPFLKFGNEMGDLAIEIKGRARRKEH